MAAAKRTFASTLLSIWLLFSFLGVSLAQQTVMASNSTTDLPQPGSSVRYILSTTNIGIPRLRLVPLTHPLAFLPSNDFKNINITGPLIPVGDDPGVIKQGDIASIACDEDAYPGPLTADNTVLAVVSSANPPSAVVLYSVRAHHCNYSVPNIVNYDTLFTTVDPMLASNLQARLANSSVQYFGSVLPDSTSMQQPNPSGNSSNVAMIILYSITGIITALFLVIIVTGAIRAHRHPERYGPRNGLGRPRQSRAKGLARAMLETLPIVKFGDNEERKPTADNVELGRANEDARKESTTDGTESRDGQNDADREADAAPATTAHSNASHEDNALGCSICTEDFTKGQDIRVLPCNHKFHPDCVDPWLLNVSGTCPLCRVDLRPTTSHASDTAPASPTSGELPPPLEEITEAPNPNATGRQRGSLAVYFHNLRHLRDASAEERIAALRTLHSQNQQSGGTPTDADRDRRVTSRLRDAFRIRTRRQGGDNAAVPEAEPGGEALERRRTGTYAG